MPIFKMFNKTVIENGKTLHTIAYDVYFNNTNTDFEITYTGDTKTPWTVSGKKLTAGYRTLESAKAAIYQLYLKNCIA